MKNLFTSAVGALALFTTGVTLAQNGTMMNGSMWGTGWMGGYGGIGMPVLLLVVVVLVVWIIKRGGK